MKYQSVILTLTSSQIAFIIIVPILLVLVALGIFFYLYFRRKQKRFYKENYYRKINDLVMFNDYFLINQFPIKLEDHAKTVIDHIVLAEKYIYVISDFYYEGSLTGTASDESLILIDSNDQKKYVDNPLQYNRKLLTRLAILAGFDFELLKGVVLVNDSCLLSIKDATNKFMIINRNDLKKYFKESEKEEIGEINQIQLEQAVKTLANIKKSK